MAINLTDVWTRWLFGLVGAGFLAWAGVVWNASDKLTIAIFAVQSELRVVDNRLSTIEAALREHNHKPWHDEAGNTLSEYKARIQQLERNVNGAN